MFTNTFFESRAVYKVMSKKYDIDREATDDNIIRRNRIAGLEN